MPLHLTATLHRSVETDAHKLNSVNVYKSEQLHSTAQSHLKSVIM